MISRAGGPAGASSDRATTNKHPTMKTPKAKKASAKPKAKKAKPGAENQQQPAAAANATPDLKATKPKKEVKKKWPAPRERILARHDFSVQEMAGYGGDIGRIDQDIALLQKDAKDVANDYKAKIEVKTTTRTALSQKLSNGYEMREVTAEIIYDTKARSKKFVDPHNKKHVFREEPMTENDWQLPMFRPAEVVSKKPAPAGANTQEKPPKGDNAGKTNIGAVLDLAVDEAAKALGKIEVDLDGMIGESILPEKMIKKFGSVAKKAGWEPKITKSIQKYAASKCEDGVSAVADALRPYAVDKNAAE